MRLYLLQHSYEIAEREETKILGIYSTKEEAESKIKSYQRLVGFRKYPDSFYIDEYRLNEDHWIEGFIQFSGSDRLKDV